MVRYSAHEHWYHKTVDNTEVFRSKTSLSKNETASYYKILAHERNVSDPFKSVLSRAQKVTSVSML